MKLLNIYDAAARNFRCSFYYFCLFPYEKVWFRWCLRNKSVPTPLSHTRGVFQKFLALMPIVAISGLVATIAALKIPFWLVGLVVAVCLVLSPIVVLFIKLVQMVIWMNDRETTQIIKDVLREKSEPW